MPPIPERQNCSKDNNWCKQQQQYCRTIEHRQMAPVTSSGCTAAGVMNFVTTPLRLLGSETARSAFCLSLKLPAPAHLRPALQVPSNRKTKDLSQWKDVHCLRETKYAWPTVRHQVHKTIH